MRSEFGARCSVSWPAKSEKLYVSPVYVHLMGLAIVEL